MADILMSPALQYGALFLLLVIMVGWIVNQRDRDKRTEARQDGSDKFIQDLVTKSLESQEANVQAWRAMNKESVVAQEKTVAVLDKIVARLDGAEARAEKRHEQVVRRLDREPFNASTGK